MAKITLTMIEDDLQAVSAALISKSTSFRLGAYTVSAKVVGGAPVHLTVGQALFAAALVYAGSEGDFETGNVEISIVKTP